MGIRRIRGAVRRGTYEFTLHALEQMDEDDLRGADVSSAVASGRVTARLSDDRRGTRFVVQGTPTGHAMEIEIGCRFLPSSVMRIITVYRLET